MIDVFIRQVSDRTVELIDFELISEIERDVMNWIDFESTIG